MKKLLVTLIILYGCAVSAAPTLPWQKQPEPVKPDASITSTTRSGSMTRKSGSTTRRSGSTIEIGMMMTTMMTMIEIMTGMMTKIKMRLRQTFDDKTEEIQARDDSPAWISR